jgi:PAS domain-containing protein
MKIICAWCGKFLGEEEHPKEMLSHGICPDCLRKLDAGDVISLRELIDKLEFPVLVTDGTVAIQRANRTAERAFGRPAHEMENSTLGFAIECVHARAPGECGRMEQCAGCLLRQALMETHDDGQPRHGFYSENDILTPQGTRPRRIRFSTNPVGDAVILAIEEIQYLAAAS